jgi:hypothetical protein
MHKASKLFRPVLDRIVLTGAPASTRIKVSSLKTRVAFPDEELAMGISLMVNVLVFYCAEDDPLYTLFYILEKI